MAKILPHFEIPNDTPPLQLQYFTCVGDPGDLAQALHGLTDATCPAPNLVVQQAHSGLALMIYTRRGVELALQDRSFIVQRGNRSGGDQRNIYIVLDDGGIGHEPVWSPPASPDAKQFKLLSWTSKMNCPSWSIPAGHMDIGGSCPGAAGGQSVLSVDTLTRGRKQVAAVMGAEPDVSTAICEFCYATGGQYSTGNVQFAQILRYVWAQNAIDIPVPSALDGSNSTLFVETMVAAVESANYKLEGGSIQVEVETATGEETQTQTLPPEATDRRFFRVHDSGDFFSIAYLEQWCEIARRCPTITFWAPSRAWAAGRKFLQAVNTFNKSVGSDGKPNFIIRPSGYNVNGKAPPAERLVGSANNGWAAGSTALMHSQDRGMDPSLIQYVAKIEKRREHFAPDGPDDRYHWSCRAYSTNDQKHTCRKAVAPPPEIGGPGGTGCRACWDTPHLVVMYTLH
jgi:hypothetical protein